MSNTATATTLNAISARLNDILPMIFLVTGTFGHVCNIAVFSQRTQRTNPISIYFLSTTVANLIVLYLGMLPRFIQDIADIDWITNNIIACRVRSFFFNLSLSLFNWFMLLGTINRYLISSNNNRRRQLSTMKNAYRVIGILTISFTLSYSHNLILYNVQIFGSSSNRSQPVCVPSRGIYRILCDVQLLVQFSLLPPMLMSIFVILTIRNIRLSYNRIVNTIIANQHARLRRRDLQSSQMLVAQVCLTILCSLPLAVAQLVATMTSTWPSKPPVQYAIENFISQIGRHLAFFNCSIPFYLYTLTGSQFRLEIRRLINRSTMFFCHKQFLKPRRIQNNQNLVPAGQIARIDLRNDLLNNTQS